MMAMPDPIGSRAAEPTTPAISAPGTPPPQTATPRPTGTAESRTAFSGRQVVWAGVVCGSGGLMVGLFLRAVVARSTVQLPSYSLFWLVLVLGAMGCLGGMAVEAVRQLQCSNPDPQYHPFQRQHRRLAEERHRRRQAAARR